MPQRSPKKRSRTANGPRDTSLDEIDNTLTRAKAALMEAGKRLRFDSDEPWPPSASAEKQYQERLKNLQEAAGKYQKAKEAKEAAEAAEKPVDVFPAELRQRLAVLRHGPYVANKYHELKVASECFRSLHGSIDNAERPEVSDIDSDDI